jgi:prepilin-type N-terminal cleavage/methylation domain-containing protein
MLQLKQKQAGFTIIEMIVSLGLFSVVVTIAMGALLMLVAANNNVPGEQAVMTNLSFALDSMTREIRVGTEYYCNSRSDYSAGGSANIFDGNIPTNPTDGNDLDGILGDDTNDCEDGLGNSGHKLQGVAFNEGGDSITQAANKRILYFF